MGNKVNPVVFRLYEGQNWKSKWFSSKREYFIRGIFEDEIVRRIIDDYYFGKPVAKVTLERNDSSMNIIVYTDRVNALVGHRGSYVEELRCSKIAAISLSKDINISIVEHKGFTARYIVDLLCYILESRGNYRKVLRRLEYQLSHSNMRGFKIMMSGRLDGSEKKRRALAKAGKLPLQTISANIDYAFRAARTKYGIIGVKAWLCMI